ncbi:type II toxin-antitoxin system ParD family antitoxin [Parahaliea aestuarii]|uniref:Antitoxin ParD n=1 Tax=Parahaliea aestuarii TaxID=1852021 RepID=A0A5C8ZLR1_9GAMM|nr:type II toxin-antitoxin system ParD family antitoxin [Parahaliea aestuarii]TXS89398.1 type II toxin-antitoxin system ParD family antitoxin [Parahaliea aestuarii]
MHVSLTPELEAIVKAKVESGLYNNASEVVREALRFVETHDAWLREWKTAELRRQVQLGVSQLDAGEGVSVTNKAELDELITGASQ